MDQLKEILRQAIKYRFWIAVGISVLVPVVAYLVGSGPVQAKTATETTKIRDSKKKVEAYSNGVVPNRQYPPLVAEKTTVLAKDVSGAWKKLYARQAPLLTWPERVQERFRTWGRKWPENEDSSRVQFAIIDYITDYKTYVDEVYESFHPFNTETGKGVVAAPPKETLLRPAKFDESKLPDLGKVWAAQERLWLQRTMLEVITNVNKNAKDWDSAIVRQINTLEVGNAAAQDQRSLAKGDTLEEAPALTDPKAPPPAEPAADASANPMQTMGGYGGMMGGADKEKLDSVYYLKKTEGATSEQYKVLPVQMSVLVEQSHVPDFLVALENSPMAIQVMEFEISKPSAKVEKPALGSNLQYAAYGGNSMMDMMSMYRRMGVGGRTAGFGGNAAMQQMMNMNKMYGGGRGGDAGPATPKRVGVDKRAEDRKKSREEGAKKEEEGKSKQNSSHDPYYNIVSVTIYGQARFYNPPPPEPVAETSQTATAPAEGDEKAKAETAKTEEEKPKADATKDESEKAKAEADKPDAEKAKDDAPKDKAEKAKDEADKPDAEKAKDNAPKYKAEKAKDEAEKPDAENDKAPKAKAEAPKDKAEAPKK